MDEFLDGLRCEIRLVPDADQGGVRRFRKRTQADGDRATDAVFGMGILDRRQCQAREGLDQARVGRDNGNERPKAGLQEAASRPADHWLTTPRFEQLLASEPRRLSGGEQNAGDQTAGVAALSSWSTQVANRWAIRCATSCMMPVRPNWATTPLTARSVVITTLVPVALGWSCAVMVAEAPPRPRVSAPSALTCTVCVASSMLSIVIRPL